MYICKGKRVSLNFVIDLSGCFMCWKSVLLLTMRGTMTISIKLLANLYFFESYTACPPSYYAHFEYPSLTPFPSDSCQHTKVPDILLWLIQF